MSERDFRFGLVTATASSGDEWLATARRAEELGYDTLLVPDTLHTIAPFPALAAAAAVTRTLRVGTYVLSVPNRSPALVAWETRALQLLSSSRFELGLGAGRPGAERDAEALGGEFGTAGQRVRRVADTIHAVRDGGGDPPRILVAAGRPAMLRLAAEHADTVAVGLPPHATEDELAAAVAVLRDAAGSRFESLELHVNVAAVAPSADAVPQWVSRMVGGDPRQVAAAGGIAFLLGDAAEIAGTLRRRRAELGITYIGVSGAFAEQFAPVMAQLRGR